MLSHLKKGELFLSLIKFVLKWLPIKSIFNIFKVCVIMINLKTVAQAFGYHTWLKNRVWTAHMNLTILHKKVKLASSDSFTTVFFFQLSLLRTRINDLHDCVKLRGNLWLTKSGFKLFVSNGNGQGSKYLWRWFRWNKKVRNPHWGSFLGNKDI